MNRCLSAVVYACTAYLALGCAELAPPSVRAAQVAQGACTALPPDREALPMIQTLTVLKAEPTCHTDYCSEAAQVYGVKVVVDRPAGVSPLQLANLLRCHGARALLGQATALADDPYFLPDGWVYIGLEDAGRNFVVTLNGDTVANNLRILHRATAFAGAHGLPATN